MNHIRVGSHLTRFRSRCSRQFPCSSCVKKGCGAICPEGSLTTGKGNRFVLANTEILHEKISELSIRIRNLEDGLSESHSRTSIEPHPLLTPELRSIKRPLEREPAVKTENTESPSEGVEAMGSLSISDGGRSTFYGQAANSFNETAPEEEPQSPEPDPIISPNVPWSAYAFPFAPSVGKSGQDIRATLFSQLPREATARRFAESYYQKAAWMYAPISRAEFYEKIYNPIFVEGAAETITGSSLAVCFSVLCFGAYMDLNLPPHSEQATQLYQLSRAALSMDPILDEPSIPAIQALVLMVHYMFFSGTGNDARWVLMGLVVKLAHSLGLHRDSQRWNLDPLETYKRRCLLYEIYTYDSFQSLTFGRPPTFSLAHIDTKLPHESTKNAAGEVEMSFHGWKHLWSTECLSVVHDRVFGARAPTYSTVLELEKKVRNHYVPPSLRVPGFITSTKTAIETPVTLELTLQRYCTFGIREIALFYMHRGFFASALADESQDPMSGTYAPSVLAAYTSACTYIALIDSLFALHPELTERMSFYFSHVFSCAIVLGSIASKSRLAVAPSALSHFESAYRLFERVSDRAQTAKMLPVLHKLKSRAHAAFLTPSPSISSPQIKTEVDEIAALGGATRLVTRRTTSPSSPSHSDVSPQPASPPMFDSPQSWPGFSPSQDFGYAQYSLMPSDGFDPYAFNSYPSPNENVPMLEDLGYSWTTFVQQFRE
uniref:Xylanolytic transcriptional activator regulatory domain-containing protein n=1 Tax=Mycena chlorophos TaxID=658473 RepID=A0ABQ0KVF9_MYCCL|nr:predicted protein [Mycena chlorophos]